MSKVSKVLRNSRKNASVTQTELAIKLGFGNGQFVSNIERGVATLPTSHFKTAARLLKIPVSKLITAAVQDYKQGLKQSIR